MRVLLFLLALSVAVSLAGCATTMAKVAPGSLTIRNELTVNLTQDWNQLVPGAGAASAATGASEIWTTEGMPIDVLAFYVGLAHGERLSRATGVGNKHVPHFRSSMSPHEIVELYEAHATQGGSDFAITRLAPVSFGGKDGFRFEFSLVRRGDSLPMSGVAYAAVAGGKLYLMAYVAPRSYFFARHLPEVEAVAASARIASPESTIGPSTTDSSTRSSRMYGFGHPGATQELEEANRNAASAGPAPVRGSAAEASRIKPPGYPERGQDSGGNIRFQSQGPGGPERGVYQNPLECGGRMCR